MKEKGPKCKNGKAVNGIEKNYQSSAWAQLPLLGLKFLVGLSSDFGTIFIQGHHIDVVVL